MGLAQSFGEPTRGGGSLVKALLRIPVLLLVTAILVSVVAVGQTPDPTERDASIIDTSEVDTVLAPPPPETDLERSRRLLGELVGLEALIEKEVSESRRLLGEDRELKRVAILSLVDDMNDIADQIVGVVPDLDSTVVDSIITVAEAGLRYPSDLYLRAAQSEEGTLSRLRLERAELSPEELGELELRIRGHHERADRYLEGAIASTRRLDRVGLGAEDLWEEIDETLIRRAESLGGRIQINVASRNRLRDQVKSFGGSEGKEAKAAQLRLQAIQQRVNVLVGSLKITADYMSSRNLAAAEYDELIIRVTGEITEDILNPEVIRRLAKNLYQDSIRWLEHNGPTVLVRIGLLVLCVLLTQLGFWLGWLLILLFTRPSQLLRNMLRGLLRPTATFVGLMIGLWALGVNPATLLAGVGVLSVIIGLALQDSLGNLAAGVFILLYKPYDVDEVIQAGGVLGLVKRMGLANTTIVTFDRRRLFVPNRKIWSEVIENRSSEPLRRIDAKVRIGYDEDLEGTIEYLREVMRDHDLVLDEPVTEVFVSGLEDSWIEISVWPWTRSENWWTMETILRKVLRLALDRRGIAQPIPRHDVMLPDRHQPDSSAPETD